MIIKQDKFNEYVQNNVFDTLNNYGLIKNNEKIMVAVSGGKDSILTLHMLKKYQDQSNINFELNAVCIDEGIAGYRDHGIELAKENCNKLDIPLVISSFNDEWKHDLDDISNLYKSTCMPCGVYRRYLLNKIADMYNSDKIATGHNLDDEIQSFLMTFARNDQNKFPKFTPILDRIHENLVPRIKPLWQLPEKDVGTWCVVNDVPIHKQECPYSTTSLRADVKNFLNKLEERMPGSKKNIFNSFKKTFNLPKKEVKLVNCELCGQSTASSPCKACIMTKEIENML